MRKGILQIETCTYCKKCFAEDPNLKFELANQEHKTITQLRKKLGLPTDEIEMPSVDDLEDLWNLGEKEEKEAGEEEK